MSPPFSPRRPRRLRSSRFLWLLKAGVACVLGACGTAGGVQRFAADDYFTHAFQRIELTSEYYSEGANAGDLNRDGKPDIVSGPYWYVGPSFQEKHAIYPPVPQNREGYADNFFSWVYDFTGDGWGDVLVVGFPGTPAYVYENPREQGGFWKKHQVFDWVSNESPHFTQLVGDERPELVCTRDGYFGYAEIDWSRPLEAWKFRIASEQVATPRFGHGLGVGDINGDGRMDILHQHGWLEQPESLEGEPRWKFHRMPFTEAGGAEMHAYDVDGDGDNDVITSLAAHEFGLAWFEQLRQDGEIAFREHLIMGSRPEENRYGVLFSELHSVNLADIDGDGFKDIVTGKTYYSHHKQSPLWDAGAVVYWFRLSRGEQGVDWIPHRADGEAGIGRQVVVHDVSGDGLLDIVVGGMKGAHAMVQSRTAASPEQWREAQPKPIEARADVPARAPEAPIDDQTGVVPGAMEAETLVVSVSAGEAAPQEMGGFKRGRWSGDAQLFWRGGKPGQTLTLKLPVAESGEYDLEIVFTKARDYGKVKLCINGELLAEEVDLYNYPDVISSGVLSFPGRKLSPPEATLSLELSGAHPSATPAYFAGIDYVRLLKAR